MELFVIIINGFQPLTISTMCSILDLAAVLDPHLMMAMMMMMMMMMIMNCFCHIKSGSRPSATSKMERIVIIVNDWKPLIITKRPILDVKAALNLPLL